MYLTKFVAGAVFTFFCFFALIVTASAQTSAFNFQGRLNDGSSPANGRFDLQFRLYDQIAGGTQIGSTIDRPNLLLINGVFSTTLDFGTAAFSTSGNRFLEILVRPAGSPNAYVVLGARQQILSVPFAVRSASATNADFATNAQNATNATNATTAQNSLSLGGVSSSNYARLNFANQGDISAANMSTTGYISVGGNAIQPVASNGLPKAMVYVTNPSPSATVSNCYNGVTGASTPATCGFTVSEPLGSGVGVYSINFGFSVTNRFLSITPRSQYTPLINMGANFRYNAGNLEVLTFQTSSSNNNTFPSDFLVVVY